MIKGDQYRNNLISRNLYSPEKEYPLSDPSTVTKIVNSVSSIVSALTPFKGINISDSLLGRVLSDKSPITEIGLICLANQLGNSVKSNVISDTIPQVKLNLLPTKNTDGKRDKLIEFIKKEDYSITSKKDDIGIINSFEKLFNYTPNNINFKPENSNPKRPNIKTNYGETLKLDDVLSKTGKGQISELNQNLNENLYRSDSYINNSLYSKYFSLTSRHNLIRLRQRFVFNQEFDPYERLFQYDNDLSSDISKINIDIHFQNDNLLYNEYGQNIDFVKNLGETIKPSNFTKIPNNFKDLSSSQKEEWYNYNNVEYYYDDPDKLFIWSTSGNTTNSFSIKDGLLAYTQGLVKATKGNVIVSNKERFENKDGEINFNGSMYRQNTISNPYGSYQKAIRFKGNGVKNSVISETVMPKMHPNFLGKGEDDDWKRNIMFSIENLAYNIEDGSVDFLPEYEKGVFNGRLMWFPPYDIQINEVAKSNIETTTFIGRNEPIYSYVGSERTATISFKMIVDYPMALNLMDNKTNNRLNYYFAYGDDINSVKRLKRNNEKLPERLSLETELPIASLDIDEQPDVIRMSKESIFVSFMNNYPTESNVNTVFDIMFKEGYEVGMGIKPNDVNTFGMNSDVYTTTGAILPSTDPYYAEYVDPATTISQYETTNEDNLLTRELIKFYKDKKNRKFYDIEIDTGTSTLGGDDYNKALSQRRLDATINLIRKRLNYIFDNDSDIADIKIKSNSFGSSMAVSPFGHLLEFVSYKETKLDRFAKIRIVRNEVVPEEKEPTLNSNESEKYKSVVETDLISYDENSENNVLSNNPFGIHFAKISVTDDGKLSGYGTLKDNKFKPVFHSQTPEDFHRRLTFLHQCTRQGNPILSDKNTEFNNSVFGRQPICVLRIGDFFHTHIIIDTVTFDYKEAVWDFNPEGFGAQPMIADITLQTKVIGGQSLEGPIKSLQNALSFNYYANSTFPRENPFDVYSRSIKAADNQYKKQ